MIHLPFLGGLAIGAGIVLLLNNKKAKDTLCKSKEYMSSKIEEGVERVKNLKEKKCSSDDSEKGQEEPKSEEKKES